MTNHEKLIHSSKGNFYLWLEFEHFEWKPDDDPYDDFFNMAIIFERGPTYELDVWTFKYLFTEIKEEIDKDIEGKRKLAGKYLKPPDLFIEKLDRELIESIVLNMIENDELMDTWKVTKNEDCINDKQEP